MCTVCKRVALRVQLISVKLLITKRFTYINCTDIATALPTIHTLIIQVKLQLYKLHTH